MSREQKGLMTAPPPYRKSNNGDTLAELERQQQEVEERINVYAMEVRKLKAKLKPAQDQLERAFMEKTNIWTRIRIWKQEMGVKP